MQKGAIWEKVTSRGGPQTLRSKCPNQLATTTCPKERWTQTASAPGSSVSQAASSCNCLMQQHHKLFTYLCSIYPKAHNTTKNDHTASNLNEKLLFIHFHCNVTRHKILWVHEATSALLIIRIHYHFDEAFTQNCRTISELLRCSQHPN